MTKYIYGLEDGELPTSLLFSGTVFHAGQMGLQIAQIPWDREASYRVPVRVWKEMMDLYYPNSAWIHCAATCSSGCTRFKSRNGIPTWEQRCEAHVGPDRGGEVVNRELAKKVADAVLYEGYMLYPYRPSAIKNRQRWTFGILYPQAFDEVQQGTERAGMHSECLLTASGDASVQIELRFLHLLAKQVTRAVEDRFELVALSRGR